ncbi:hypothetical protein Ntsu_80570 [Nocardia sp. IFM 10818]
MSSGAAAPVAAGGVVLMLAMTAFIAVWSEEESTTTCTVDGTDTVLVGAVAPSTTSAAPAAATGASGQRVMPLAEGTYTVSSGFGPREGGDHMGVDLAAPEGTPIFAATDGVVVAAGAASGFGHWIVIDTTDESGKALSTVYGHMYASGVKVQVGQTVSAGQHIADVGNDGQSTGAHLHFEVVPGGRLTGGSQQTRCPGWPELRPRTAAARDRAPEVAGQRRPAPGVRHTRRQPGHQQSARGTRTVVPESRFAVYAGLGLAAGSASAAGIGIPARADFPGGRAGLDPILAWYGGVPRARRAAVSDRRGR